MNFLKKVNVLRSIWKKLDAEPYNIYEILGPRDHLYTLLKSELSALLQPRSMAEINSLQEMIDTISSNLLNETPKKQDFNKLNHDTLENQLWNFSQVSGMAVVWELKLKLLAEKFKVEVYKTETRSSKEKKHEMLSFKDLSPIIADFQTKTNKRFSLNLKPLSELRSNLVHGNLEQLRTLANNCRSSINTKHKGNLMVCKIESGDITNLSEKMEYQKKTDFGMFAWFIEGANSSLLNDIWEIFSESMSQMNMISLFHSISYDERQPLFEKFVFEKHKLSKDEKDLYTEVFKDLKLNFTVEQFFTDLEKICNTQKKRK